MLLNRAFIILRTPNHNVTMNKEDNKDPQRFIVDLNNIDEQIAEQGKINRELQGDLNRSIKKDKITGYNPKKGFLERLNTPISVIVGLLTLGIMAWGAWGGIKKSRYAKAQNQTNTRVDTLPQNKATSTKKAK